MHVKVPTDLTVVSGRRPKITVPADLETASSGPEPDVYNLGKGKKTDSELRNRSRKSKKVAAFHKEQNEVCIPAYGRSCDVLMGRAAH